MAQLPAIAVLTGAGISAESGLRTFRAADGLWEDHPIEQVATPEGFAADPALVQRFYNERRAGVRAATPNSAHEALADFESAWAGDFLLVTQNIDDLHERAGSVSLAHMHGEINKAQCTACPHVCAAPDEMAASERCPACGHGNLRPHIVWFGEMPLQMQRIQDALRDCDMFIAIGTSGNVYPAAGFVELARAAGARCVEVNLDDTATSTRFHERRTGLATEQVGLLLKELLEEFR